MDDDPATSAAAGDDALRPMDEAVRRALVEQTYLELATTLMMPVRYGIGFMLGGERLSLYGSGTPRAFGHIGFTNVLVWADVERDISVAFLNNGKPFITLELLRWLAIPRMIADLVPRYPS